MNYSRILLFNGLLVWHEYRSCHAILGSMERIFGSSGQQLYAFYNKTASMMTDATIALNRSSAESYGGSKDVMAAEKNAMASARIVFEDKFADPESL